MIRLFPDTETEELSSRFHSLAIDVHRKAALLSDRLSKLDRAPEHLPNQYVVRRVINLIALNHRLIQAGTEMVNQGVEGGIPLEANGTHK